MKLGRRCKSNAHFAGQFQGTIRNNGGKPLEGTIIRDDGSDILKVQWDTLKTPWSLHVNFLTFPRDTGADK